MIRQAQNSLNEYSPSGFVDQPLGGRLCMEAARLQPRGNPVACLRACPHSIFLRWNMRVISRVHAFSYEKRRTMKEWARRKDERDHIITAGPHARPRVCCRTDTCWRRDASVKTTLCGGREMGARLESSLSGAAFFLHLRSCQAEDKVLPKAML